MDYTYPGYQQVIHDCYTGHQYMIANIDGISATVQNVNTGEMHMADMNQIRAILSGTSLAAAGLPFQSLSDDERKELDELEVEYESFKKRQQLMKFQGLPSDIRQDIVNESKGRDFINSFDEVENGDFDSYDRMKELRAKKGPQVHFRGMNHFDLQHTQKWRYEKILDIFSTQELEEAHATAILEEELSDG